MTQDSMRNKMKPAPARKAAAPTLSRWQQRREAFLAKCRTWDWSKPDAELAEEMGFSNSSIGMIRRRIGAPKSPHFHQRRSKFREPNLAKWRSWDWTKQDAELARETGLTRERIRQIRRLLGAPKSLHHNRHPTQSRQTLIKLQWAAENLDRLKGLTVTEMEREYGIYSQSPVLRFLRAQGVLRHGCFKHPWHLMNFELPSGVLERIWKLASRLAAKYRYQKRLTAPKWALFGGLAALQRRGQLRAFNRAVRAEERKAAKYFAERDRAWNGPRGRR